LTDKLNQERAQERRLADQRQHILTTLHGLVAMDAFKTYPEGSKRENGRRMLTIIAELGLDDDTREQTREIARLLGVDSPDRVLAGSGKKAAETSVLALLQAARTGLEGLHTDLDEVGGMLTGRVERVSEQLVRCADRPPMHPAPCPESCRICQDYANKVDLAFQEFKLDYEKLQRALNEQEAEVRGLLSDIGFGAWVRNSLFHRRATRRQPPQDAPPRGRSGAPDSGVPSQADRKGVPIRDPRKHVSTKGGDGRRS
jgi:hypothetical protein